MTRQLFSELVKAGILRVSDGYRAKNDELGGDGPVFLRSAYLQDQGFVLGQPDRFQAKTKANYGDKIAVRGDTVITTKGNSTGRVGFVEQNVEGSVYSPHLSYWRSLDLQVLWPRYLYYWSRSDALSSQLAGLAYSTDMAPYLSLRDQMFLSISLPPLTEQREIAAILGALDDKIEVNRKASATLEAMARALYRSWFVDFDPVWAKVERRPPAHMPPETAALFPDSFDDDGLPLGWRFGTLGDVAMTARNGVKPEQIHPETPYIGLEHMPRRSIALSDWGLAADVGSQKSGMLAGDFMFGKLRPYFHKVGVAPVDGICSTDIIVLRPKTPEWGGFILSVISSDAFVEHTNSGSSGTRMPRTNWSDMAAYEMPLPPAAVSAEFEAIVKPWRDRIVAGIHENQSLAALRDSLLPRLMSGELRVGDARAQVEEVA